MVGIFRDAICDLLLLSADEAVFIETPVVVRIMPAGNEWPGAREADDPNYIAEQLSGV